MEDGSVRHSVQQCYDAVFPQAEVAEGADIHVWADACGFCTTERGRLCQHLAMCRGIGLKRHGLQADRVFYDPERLYVMRLDQSRGQRTAPYLAQAQRCRSAAMVVGTAAAVTAPGACRAAAVATAAVRHERSVPATGGAAGLFRHAGSDAAAGKCVLFDSDVTELEKLLRALLRALSVQGCDLLPVLQTLLDANTARVSRSIADPVAAAAGVARDLMHRLSRATAAAGRLAGQGAAATQFSTHRRQVPRASSVAEVMTTQGAFRQLAPAHPSDARALVQAGATVRGGVAACVGSAAAALSPTAVVSTSQTAMPGAAADASAARALLGLADSAPSTSSRGRSSATPSAAAGANTGAGGSRRQHRRRRQPDWRRSQRQLCGWRR
jgi:hypothetical protein